MAISFDYDEETDSAYVKISEAEIEKTQEVEDGILVDLDAEGRLVGIEILFVHGKRQLFGPEIPGLKQPRREKEE